jgi:hypothetical protein
MPQFKHNFKVKSRHFVWDKLIYPEEEDKLGDKLFSLVVEKSFQGSLPVELWLFTNGAIQTFAFHNSVSHNQVSALCGMDGVKCAALLGAIGSKNNKRLGQVFIEWDDCRWWFGRQPLLNDGSIAFQIPKVTKASALDGKPMELGGWFSTARRLGLQAKMNSDNKRWIH